MLGNDALELVVVPELGAKISSLVTRPSGREWLWRNQRMERRRAKPGESYVGHHDTGGIDECFPTIAPTRALPDHGELWSQPWEVEEESAQRLTLSARGAGYQLRRTVFVPPAAPRLELEYELDNAGAHELHFVWCLHALFALEPGMQIELPHATPLCVPDPRAPGFRASAEKRFVGPLAQGSVALRSADGREALRFSFDSDEVPFVGLWLNFGGWAGDGGEPYFNLGIEPSIGDADSLDEARARGTAGVLAPRALHTWRVALERAR